MSVSDLMTGLMVIFLFIAVAYMSRVESEQSPLKDFVDNKRELHNKMKEMFKEEAGNGTLTIGGDLTMRFERAETLFPLGSDALTPEFQQTLREVMPKYLDIILTDSLKEKIREIRIEGHTDDTPFPRLDADPYKANLILSQQRARNVLFFIRSLPEYNAYSDEDKRRLDIWLTATGFSYGRALDAAGNSALQKGTEIDAEKSRRVEIRIVTSGEEVLERFIENTN